jgi:hypothetical protein
VFQGRVIAADGGRIDVVGIGPSLQVSEKGCDQIGVVQPSLAHLAGSLEVGQPLLDRAGADNRGDQVAIDAVAAVPPGSRVPPLQDKMPCACVDADAPRCYNAVRKSGHAPELMLGAVPDRPGTRLLGRHAGRSVLDTAGRQRKSVHCSTPNDAVPSPDRREEAADTK